MPRLCEVYPGICLTTEEKARKNLSQVYLKYAAFYVRVRPVILYERPDNSRTERPKRVTAGHKLQ